MASSKTNVHAVRRLHICGLLLFLAASIFAGQALAQRAIPEDNLAYPVLITVKNNNKPLGMASGFYLSTDHAVYLVTAKHVLSQMLSPDTETYKIADTELELLSYSKDLPNPRRILLTLGLSALKESGAVRLHASKDVAIVRLTATATTATTTTTTNKEEARRSNSFLPGVMANENAEGPLLGVALSAVKTYDQVLVGNDAIMYGYPVSLGFPQHPQFESDRPLLRRALVAGQDGQKRTIILDSPSYPGNSGGPIFQIERNGATTHFNLIGIVSSRIPLLRAAADRTGELQLLVGFNSGYSVAEPMDFVLELIDQDVAEKTGAPRVADAVPPASPEARTSAGQNQPNKIKASKRASKNSKVQRKKPSSPTARSKRRPDARDNAGQSRHRDAASL